ncbi:hypothetical protein N431DRAFT_529122 [Stipitochalara longipes BDJ]|nr:hypothetical protein N431DRAFT_529122 [Stipitochalara longipes BDJ]
MTTTSSQPVCSCANSTADPLANIIQDITAGIEGGIGNLVEGFIQNITGSIESGPDGSVAELGQFFDGLLKNITEKGNGTSTGSSTDLFIQNLVSNIISKTGSRLLDSLTGSGSGLKVLLSNIISNFTTKVDNGLSKAEGTVAEGITNALGIQEFYSLHLRDVCSGTLSNSSDPHAKFNITACFPYSVAASGLVGLISKIPSSTTVLTTNITIPVITQVQEMSVYLTNLTNTLDQVIFAFYIIALISSGFVILGSIAQFLLPTSGMVMYANLITSTLTAAFALSASVTTTAFITTANNIINIFGTALGLRAELSPAFLALTWAGFAAALLTNWYLVAVWFVEFRTISVKVQRRSPQDMGNWRNFGVFRESKGGFVEETVQEVIEERPEPNIGRNTSMATRRLSTRFGRRNSTSAHF